MQAETIDNKLNDEKVLRYKIVYYNHFSLRTGSQGEMRACIDD